MKSRQVVKQAERFSCMFLVTVLATSLLSCGSSSRASNDNISHPASDQNLVKRAVLDIGSGSTKIQIAEVNAAQSKIVSYETFGKGEVTSIAVDYKDKANQEIPNQVNNPSGKKYAIKESFYQKAGLAAVQALVSLAVAHGVNPAHIRGIATEAIREASNSADIINYYKLQTGIQIQAITQEEEAQIGAIAGFSAAKNQAGVKFVWDIGGGSAQIIGPATNSAKSGNGIVVKSKIASKEAAKVLIEQLRKDANLKSPNPIASSTLESQSQVKLAISLIESRVKSELSSDLQKAVKDAGNALIVVGIGGVHNKSIPGSIASVKGGMKMVHEANKVTLEQIEKRAEELASLSDDDLVKADPKEKFADKKVSNLILVAAYMRAYGISHYYSVDVSIADGALVSELPTLSWK